MNRRNKQSGFSAIELLITLFIAAAFLICGYQLYDLIIKDSGETRQQSRAGNVAYEYLQRYKSSSSVKSPCEATSSDIIETPTVSGLSNVSIAIKITCPYTTGPTPINTLSKVSVTLTYGSGSDAKSVNVATYVTK